MVPGLIMVPPPPCPVLPANMSFLSTEGRVTRISARRNQNGIRNWIYVKTPVSGGPGEARRTSRALVGAARRTILPSRTFERTRNRNRTFTAYEYNK